VGGTSPSSSASADYGNFSHVHGYSTWATMKENTCANDFETALQLDIKLAELPQSVKSLKMGEMGLAWPKHSITIGRHFNEIKYVSKQSAAIKQLTRNKRFKVVILRNQGYFDFLSRSYSVFYNLWH